MSRNSIKEKSGIWRFTDDSFYLVKWNDFISRSKSSSFLQSTHRLSSYRKFGGNFELMLHTDDQNEILMGSANIIIRFNLQHSNKLIQFQEPVAKSKDQSSDYLINKQNIFILKIRRIEE